MIKTTTKLRQNSLGANLRSFSDLPQVERLGVLLPVPDLLVSISVVRALLVVVTDGSDHELLHDASLWLQP